jgi:hypothetical protein
MNDENDVELLAEKARQMTVSQFDHTLFFVRPKDLSTVLFKAGWSSNPTHCLI